MSKKRMPVDTSDITNSSAAVPIEKTMRADAQKNRDKLLRVAHMVFTTEGIAVSMDEIARRAGVGVGTVYRHFPTKEDLFGAVIVSHKTRLNEEAKQLLSHSDPGEAFFLYFTRIIREGITNKAITDALVSSLNAEVGLSQVAKDFWGAIDLLLIRAQQTGSVRADARIADIQVLLSGILQATGDSGTFPDRVVSILCDGLRGGKT
jgi:AcrR family transcriptional regulator